MEEHHVAGVDHHRDGIGVLARHTAERVHAVIHVTDVLDDVEVVESFLGVHGVQSVGRGIDRFGMRSGDHPQAAVFLVGAVERHPYADHDVWEGGDVVRVLVPALAALAGRVQEQHGLQRQNVWPDQRLQHVKRARVQQIFLGGGVGAVQHVDAREAPIQLVERGVRRRRLQPGQQDPPVQQVHRERLQRLHVLGREQVPHDQVTVAVIVAVLAHFDLVPHRASELTIRHSVCYNTQHLNTSNTDF